MEKDGGVDHSDHVDDELLGEVLTLLDDEGPEGLLKACDLFRSSVPDRLRDIGTALAEGRFEDAARASHSLRGSAGAFGARRLSSLGELMEQQCRDGEGRAAVALLGEMRTEFDVFRDILDQRLADVVARHQGGR